jgi:hypothetical protein
MGYKHQQRELIILFMFQIFIFTDAFSQEKEFEKLREFDAPEARQGIAVDDSYIYVVDTKEIAKYDKQSLERVKKWKGEENGSIIHLDSGVIIEGKLYCAHSNYPNVPMTSSIEIWDAESLQHVGSHSFGIKWGSCTWLDRFDGYWYAVFANYKEWEHLTGKDAKWTTLVKFDDNWSGLETWIFPDLVVKRFGNMSNSGGSFGPDGLLYCTGHDAEEVYVIQLPNKGSILKLVKIMPIDIFGQGIAWDRTENNIIYGIKKKLRKVVISRLKDKL